MSESVRVEGDGGNKRGKKIRDLIREPEKLKEMFNPRLAAFLWEQFLKRYNNEPDTTWAHDQLLADLKSYYIEGEAEGVIMETLALMDKTAVAETVEELEYYLKGEFDPSESHLFYGGKMVRSPEVAKKLKGNILKTTVRVEENLQVEIRAIHDALDQIFDNLKKISRKGLVDKTEEALVVSDLEYFRKEYRRIISFPSSSFGIGTKRQHLEELLKKIKNVNSALETKLGGK